MEITGIYSRAFQNEVQDMTTGVGGLCCIEYDELMVEGGLIFRGELR